MLRRRLAQAINNQGLNILGAHEEYKGMLVAHALGSLGPEDGRLIERHIVECPACAVEFESEREMAATLAYAAPLSEPRVELRTRILEAIHADRRRARSRVEATSQTSTGEVVPFVKAARPSWATATRLTAIAASLAFIALAISLVVQWRRNNTLQGEISQISSRLNQAQEELARERDAIKLMTGPNVQMTSLAGTEMASNAYAKFIFDRNTGRALLMADNLPAAPAGKAYQLWFIAQGKAAMPGQVFTPDASGHAVMSDQVPVEARDATVFAVTLEPQSGMKEPTGPKILLSTS